VDDLCRALDTQILKRRQREAYCERQISDATLAEATIGVYLFWTLLAISIVILIPVSIFLFYAIIPSRSGILFGLITGVVLSVALYIIGFRRAFNLGHKRDQQITDELNRDLAVFDTKIRALSQEIARIESPE
jgi:hypothetical protein